MVVQACEAEDRAMAPPWHTMMGGLMAHPCSCPRTLPGVTTIFHRGRSLLLPNLTSLCQSSPHPPHSCMLVFAAAGVHLWQSWSPCTTAPRLMLVPCSWRVQVAVAAIALASTMHQASSKSSLPSR